jgi:N-methylhydantoinase B
MFNGKNGSKAKFLKNDENADPSGLTFLDPGDRISFVSAGGGGYGDPFERDPEAVEKDVQYGYVSIEKAKQDYGVVIEPETLTLNLTATLQLREKR